MRKVYIIAATFALMLSTSKVYAADKDNKSINEGITNSASPSAGVVKGRVVDNHKEVLPGASIQIVNTNNGTVSDLNGFYTLTNLNPGSYKIKVSYVGYEPLETEISVIKGRTTVRDIVLNDAIELREAVVKGAFSGQRRAINVQKNNFGVTNVVSADQVGKFPDSNIGDALKRISGINVQYDQGEARFGQVRGTSADLSSVTVNGNRVPSAEGDTRNVQLDLIPADMVQTIEVNKVVTADMDGDAIGGSINLVTKNSPYRKILNFTAGSGYNFISDKAQLNLGATYGDRFFGKKLGVLLSASYQNAPSGSDNTEFVWSKDENGKAYVSDYQIRQYYVTRERQSYSASIDYAFNRNHKLTFKGIFNNRNDWENRYRTTLKDMDENGKATVRVQTKGGSSDNRNARLEHQRTMDFNLGGEHQFESWAIDWNGTYSRASEDRPNERYIDFQLKKQTFDVDYSDMRQPLAVAKDGSTMSLSDKFGLKELTEQQQNIFERDLKFALNIKKDFKNFGKLKFGGKIVSKKKEKDIDFYEYTPTSEDGFINDALSNLYDATRSGFMAGNKYQAGNYVSKDFLGSLNLNDDSKFEKKQVAEELATNFEAQETVSSGYVRLDTKLADKLGMVLGLRVENTNLKYTGRTYDADEDVVSKTKEMKNNYVNLLPSLLLKWDVNKDFKVRGSYTQTLSRPKYSALAPSINLSRSDNQISFGNPNLKPTTSNNFDLNGEYYFKSIGLLSAGVFYKKISNFVGEATQRDYEYNGVVYQKMKQYENICDANLLGLEFAYQRDFGFISHTMKCLGFYGTYTYTHSTTSNVAKNIADGFSLPGSPKHSANASLYFEKKGFNARLSYNYASSFLDEVGETAFDHIYYDAVNYLDLNLSYTIGKTSKYTFYAEANNLLNQPLRYYQGTKNQTKQVEYYGVKINAGVKINF